MKRGQTSIFIIIAILIVAIIVLFFVFKGNILNKEKIPVEVQPIYSFVENCIKQTGEDGVYQIGQTGGYYYAPNIDPDIAYYFDKGEGLVPSKNKIEQELSRYITEMLNPCVNNFKDFPDFEVSSRKIETNSIIEQGKVVITVEYPLTINKGDNTYNVNKFQDIDVPVRLNTIYETAKTIISDQITHPRDVCMTCVYNFAVKNDLYVDILEYDGDTIIFYVRDENSKINGEDYIFKFANRYEAKLYNDDQ